MSGLINGDPLPYAPSPKVDLIISGVLCGLIALFSNPH